LDRTEQRRGDSKRFVRSSPSFNREGSIRRNARTRRRRTHRRASGGRHRTAGSHVANRPEADFGELDGRSSNSNGSV
jgi:hypothetical protein